MKTVTKEQIVSVLKTIPDPEINVSLWDLGLIYSITIENGYVSIVMTLTSIGCPLFSTMEELIKEHVKGIPGVADVHIDLTFEPPWTMDMMSKEGKKILGIDV